MKKGILLICFAGFCLGSKAQVSTVSPGMLPFETQQYYLKAFYNGSFKQLEYVKAQSYQAGDNIIGYVDNKGDLKVVTPTMTKDIAPIQNGYVVSDNFIVFNVGTIISAWKDGVGNKLTNFGGTYIATDSLVVFEDTQQNAVKVYYNDEVIPLCSVIGDMALPSHIGDNVILYQGVGMYYVFYHGQKFPLDDWQENVDYDCGRDIAAFNDPTSYTFAIFENGQFLDLDSFHAKSFKCGIQCVTYVDNNGNLQYYSHGEKKNISNYSPDYWEAKDYMVAWGENSYFYVWDGKTKVTAATYKPKKWIIKNNIVAFQNQLGGVSCVINGQVITITEFQALDFDVKGNSVIVSLPNYNFLVYSNGKKFQT